jgi:hypothetical protein
MKAALMTREIDEEEYEGYGYQQIAQTTHHPAKDVCVCS